MIRIPALILAGFFSIALWSQNHTHYTSADSIMRLMPDSLSRSTTDIAGYVNRHFRDDESKLRAFYFWLASNITYDLEDSRDFIAEDELDEYIEGTLRWRRGKCQAYAEVFHDLCKKSEIPAKVVMGIVLPGDGEPLASHAWIAAFSSGQWNLYDPTYGSGYYLDGAFVSIFDNRYFAIDPEQLIKTHYPFDPIWQLRTYPASMRSFMRNPDTLMTGKIKYDFSDSINRHLSLSREEQLIASRKRIIQWSGPNPIVDAWIAAMDQQIGYFEKKRVIDAYNAYTETYNRMVSGFNEMVANRDFRKMNASERETLKTKLAQMQDTLRDTRSKLIGLESSGEELDEAVIMLNQAIGDLLSQTRRAAGNLERLN